MAFLFSSQGSILVLSHQAHLLQTGLRPVKKLPQIQTTQMVQTFNTGMSPTGNILWLIRLVLSVRFVITHYYFIPDDNKLSTFFFV